MELSRKRLRWSCSAPSSMNCWQPTLIPLLKQCNRNLSIILVASELPLALIRKARSEGIFYHALKPTKQGDEEELRQAVKCAFEKDDAKPCS